MRERYFRIPARDYYVPLDEEGFAYTWEWFARLQAFYQRAAAQGLAVLFTVDQ